MVLLGEIWTQKGPHKELIKKIHYELIKPTMGPYPLTPSYIFPFPRHLKWTMAGQKVHMGVSILSQK